MFVCLDGFTITNVGPLGGTGLIPTINYPEVAILGMGQARLKPVVREGAIVAEFPRATATPGILRFALKCKIKREEFLHEYYGGELDPKWLKRVAKLPTHRTAQHVLLDHGQLAALPAFAGLAQDRRKHLGNPQLVKLQMRQIPGEEGGVRER